MDSRFFSGVLFSSCKSLIARLLSRVRLPCPRDRAVVITERGVENLANFDDVPEFLKVPKVSLAQRDEIKKKSLIYLKGIASNFHLQRRKP